MNGVQRLGKQWRGAYSYLEQHELDDIRSADGPAQVFMDNFNPSGDGSYPMVFANRRCPAYQANLKTAILAPGLVKNPRQQTLASNLRASSLKPLTSFREVPVKRRDIQQAYLC